MQIILKYNNYYFSCISIVNVIFDPLSSMFIKFEISLVTIIIFSQYLIVHFYIWRITCTCTFHQFSCIKSTCDTTQCTVYKISMSLLCNKSANDLNFIFHSIQSLITKWNHFVLLKLNYQVTLSFYVWFYILKLHMEKTSPCVTYICSHFKKSLKEFWNCLIGVRFSL